MPRVQARTGSGVLSCDGHPVSWEPRNSQPGQPGVAIYFRTKQPKGTDLMFNPDSSTPVFRNGAHQPRHPPLKPGSIHPRPTSFNRLTSVLAFALWPKQLTGARGRQKPWSKRHPRNLIMDPMTTPGPPPTSQLRQTSAVFGGGFYRPRVSPESDKGVHDPFLSVG